MIIYPIVEFFRWWFNWQIFRPFYIVVPRATLLAWVERKPQSVILRVGLWRIFSKEMARLSSLISWPLHVLYMVTSMMQCDTIHMDSPLHLPWAWSKLQHLWGECYIKVTSPHCVKTESYKLWIKHPAYIPFFIITISEARHRQINCRHTIGMSTCPHCNEVQPCNLYIKCILCPFIAWRELKASWCSALRMRLVFWWGAAKLLGAILNPNWQRQDRKGGV